jgi:hypothetical protein
MQDFSVNDRDYDASVKDELAEIAPEFFDFESDDDPAVGSILMPSGSLVIPRTG